jgi:endonuclease YncB( thermonuclease family)
MKLPHFKGLSFIAVLLYLAPAGHASALQGKVMEVNEGDIITVASLNRPVKVRFMGIDAPDTGQPFCEVARKHLSDLILDKFVLVEYTGLAQNSYLVGKVFLKQLDIGAQMVRDGVAWYDKSYETNLNQLERQVYAESEKAARYERRGIWQDEAPIAPWEFKRMQIAGLAGRNTIKSSQSVPRTKRRPLTSDDILGALVSSTSSRPALADLDEGGVSRSDWRKLAPNGQHFSALVPGVGFERSTSVPAGNGKTADINYWVADYGGASYLVSWSSGPNNGYIDSSAIDETIKGLLSGLNRGFQRGGLDIVFEATAGRTLKLNGYAGQEYSLSGVGFPGVVRVFSKQTGDQREVYVIGVLNGTPESAPVDKFLNSLNLSKK